MRAHGAAIVQVKGFISSPSVTAHAYVLLSQLAVEHKIRLIVSAYRISPEGMAGVESLSKELEAQSSGVLDHIFVPVGGGGLLSAVSRGFQNSSLRPRIHAVQPAGCSTVVSAFERGEQTIHPVESTTQISGLSVPFDLDANLALSYVRDSGGAGISCTDAEIYDAQRDLLMREGICGEPAGAAALAGLQVAVRRGLVDRNGSIVCLVTGHGLKDRESIRAAGAASQPPLIAIEHLKEYLLGMVGTCA
jgi:threonine synthase